MSILYVWVQLCFFGEIPEGKEVESASFLEILFYTVIVHTLSWNEIQKTVDKSLDHNHISISWKVAAKTSHALLCMAVPIIRMYFLVMQKYDEFCLLILLTNASYPGSCFYECDDEVLRRRCKTIPKIQQTLVTKSLQGKLGMLTRHHKLEWHFGVIL